MIKPNKNIDIGTFDIDIKKLATHETSEYVAQRLQQAMQEVLNKHVKNKNTTTAFLTNQSSGGTANNRNTIPRTIGGTTKQNNNTNVYKQSTGSTAGVSPSGVQNVQESSITKESKETSLIESIDTAVATTDNITPDQTINNIATVNDKELLIQKITKKYLTESSDDYDATQVDKWNGIIEQIKKETDLDTFVKNSDNLSLQELYKEVISASKPKKELTPEVLRKRMIKEIEEKYISDEKLEPKKKSFWESILWKLNNSNIALKDILEKHKELFLFIDLLMPNEFDNLSIDLKKITAKNVYPKIGKDTIYVRLGKLKDETGKSVSKVTKDKKGLKHLIDTPIVFTANRDNVNINWKVYKKDGTLLSTHVDEGKTFTYIFKEYGEFVIEAYGSSAVYKNKKGQYKKAKNLKLRSNYIAIHIKTPELERVKVKGLKNKGHIVFNNEKEYSFKAIADVGKVEDLSTITWKKFYKNTVAQKNYEELEKDVVTEGVVLKTKFNKAGCYKIVAKSGEKISTTTFTVGGNYIRTIKEVNKKNFVLFNTSDTLAFVPSSYKLGKNVHIDKEAITWVVTKNEAIIGKPFKGEKFIVEQTQGIKEGEYKVTAYVNDTIFGKKQASTTVMVVHPEIIEAQWTDSRGVIKPSSGYKDEVNYISAKIPYYHNSKALIKLYSGNKLLYTYTTTTDNHGGIKEEVCLEDFGIENLFNEKVKFRNSEAGLLSFTIEAVGYTFKKSNVRFNNKIYVIKERSITMAYFAYRGEVISPLKHAVPYGVRIQAVIEAPNMIGEKLKTNFYHVPSQDYSNSSKVVLAEEVIVGTDGRAVLELTLPKNLEENHKKFKYFYFSSESLEGEKIIKNSFILLCFKEGDVLPEGVDLLVRSPWMKIALEEAVKSLGTHEGKEPMLSMGYRYLKAAGNPYSPDNDDFGQWCAAFTTWVVKEANYKIPNNTRSQHIVENEGKLYKRISYPIFGAITVYTRRTNTKSGHVGMLFGLDKNGDYILLGGNQGDTIKFSTFGKKKSGSLDFNGFFVPIEYSIKSIDKLTKKDYYESDDEVNKLFKIISENAKGAPKTK